jgi:hypothetical protein
MRRPERDEKAHEHRAGYQRKAEATDHGELLLRLM